MTGEPDMSHDAAALFRHLREIGDDLDRHQRWCFSFRADAIEPLVELGEFFDARLREFFHVLLQEVVTEHHADGSVIEGPPLLRLEFVGVIDEPMLEGLHDRLAKIAVDHGVRYEGATCSSEFSFDLDMFDAAMEADLSDGAEWESD